MTAHALDLLAFYAVAAAFSGALLVAGLYLSETRAVRATWAALRDAMADLASAVRKAAGK